MKKFSLFEKDRIECKPFIKWVGGKGQLLPEINKLLVDKLVELDNIYEYPAKKLFILIEPEDSYRYSRLKNLINSNKGKTQVTFAIKNKDEKKLQTINNGIKLSKKFFEDLVELMGIDKIKFEM